MNGKQNVFLSVFDGIAFSCSVALKSLGVTSASAGSKNVKKLFKNNGLAHLGGTFLEAPNWTLKMRKAFPCSVALVLFFVGAFSCSVALVF